ncbi:MAG: VapE domain-containing protein [Phocaeicola sp.]
MRTLNQKFVPKFIAWWKQFMLFNLPKLVQHRSVPQSSNENLEESTHSYSNVSTLSKRLEKFLCSRYEFRFNVLSELPEYAVLGKEPSSFQPITKRVLNSFCLEAQEAGLPCWDKDVVRLLHSYRIRSFHPFFHYMDELPVWDGVDRITPLACRISTDTLWIDGFRRWLLGLTAQWMGRKGQCANSVAPLLISSKQGLGKSTFCRLLMPDTLKEYYTDSFEMTGQASCEQKLAYFGLINLDEFDRLSIKKLPLLKNLMQMRSVNFRKAHRASFSYMPRMASFIATTNQRELLTDPTGSRRYLCMELNGKVDATPLEHKQLFAQLKGLILGNERFWFSSQEEAAWSLRNQAFYRGSTVESLFFRCFRLPEPKEEALLCSSTQIHETLLKQFPSTMQGVGALALGRQLTRWGVSKMHLNAGNVYRVIKIDEASTL